MPAPPAPPRRGPQRPVTLIVAVSVLVAGVACGGDATTTTSSPPAPATTLVPSAADLGVELFADYPRYLWHKRRLAIATTNVGSTPIEVTLVGLVADHFEPIPPEDKSAVIPPGGRTDLQVDFGELTGCTEETRAAAVEIAVARPPGSESTYVVVPIDPAPLDVIVHNECAQLAVTDAVDIRISDDWVVDGPMLEAELTLDRRQGQETVTATSMRGSELIGMRQLPRTTEPVAVLRPEDASAAVPIAFEVIRCDPHAVGQSTRTYDFKLWVAVGGREPEQMVLTLDDDLKAELTAMIGRCVDAGGP